MGERDITQKTLEGYNDIFADIVNVLLFNGEQIIDPDELIDATGFSQYKLNAKVRSQERDVAKFWKNGEIIISTIGLENQTKVDPDMPLRVLSYDGAAYRNQIKVRHRKVEGEEHSPDHRHPVVTLVLYFGREPWNKPTNLLGRVKVPDDLKPFVNDYDINLFEIAHLPKEKRELFRSDFKEVVEACADNSYMGDSDYVPTHALELMQALNALAGDSRFEDAYNAIPEEERQKGEVSMGEISDRLIEKGRAQGIQQGHEEERTENVISAIKEGLSQEQVMRIFGLTPEKYFQYANME